MTSLGQEHRNRTNSAESKYIVQGKRGNLEDCLAVGVQARLHAVLAPNG